MKKPVALIFLALAMPVCAQNPVVLLNQLKDSSRSEFEYRDSLFQIKKSCLFRDGTLKFMLRT